MPSTFLCPGCGHSVSSWATVGEKVICPGCGKSLGLILPAEPPPVRPATPGESLESPDDLVDVATYAGPANPVWHRRHQTVHPWIPAVAILSAVLLILGAITAAIVSRSSAKSNPTEVAWDVSHRPDIRALKSDAESKAISGDLQGAYQQYQSLEKLVGSNPVTDPETAELVRSAKAGQDRVYQLLLSEKSGGKGNTVADRGAGTSGNPQLPVVASSGIPNDPVRSAVAAVTQDQAPLNPDRGNQNRESQAQPGGSDSDTAVPAGARPVPTAPAQVARPPGAPAANPTVPLAAVLPGHLADQKIGQSLDAGINFLISRFNNGQIVDGRGADDVRHQGLDALCVYALLHASQGSADPRLNIHGPFMVQLLENLKAFPMAGRDPLKPMAPAVYAHSLRAAALAVYNRPEDHKALQADVNWLVNASMGGAYTYDDRYAAHASPNNSRYPSPSGSAAPVSPSPVSPSLLSPSPAPVSQLPPPATVISSGSEPHPAPSAPVTYLPDLPSPPSTPTGPSTVVSGGTGLPVYIPGPVYSPAPVVMTRRGGSSGPGNAPSHGSTPTVVGTGATSRGQTPAPSPSRGSASGGAGGGLVPTQPNLTRTMPGPLVPTDPRLGRIIPGPLVPTEPTLVRIIPGPLIPTEPSLARIIPGPLIPTEPSLTPALPGHSPSTVTTTAGGGSTVAAGTRSPGSGSTPVPLVPVTSTFGIPVYLPAGALPPTEVPTSVDPEMSAPSYVPADSFTPSVSAGSDMNHPGGPAQVPPTPANDSVLTSSLPVGQNSGATVDPSTASNLTELPEPADSQPPAAAPDILVYPAPRPIPVHPSPSRTRVVATLPTPGSGATSALPWYLVQVQENSVRNANGTTTESGSVAVNGKVIEAQTSNAPMGSVSVPIATPHGGAVAHVSWTTNANGQPVDTVSVTRNPGARGAPPAVSDLPDMIPVAGGRGGYLQQPTAGAVGNARTSAANFPNGSSGGTVAGAPVVIQLNQPAVAPAGLPVRAIALQSSDPAPPAVNGPPAAPIQPAAFPASTQPAGSLPPATQPANQAAAAVRIHITESKAGTVQTGQIAVDGVVVQRQSNTDPGGSVTVQVQTPLGIAVVVESWSDRPDGPGVASSITPPHGAALVVPAGTTVQPGEIIGLIAPLGDPGPVNAAATDGDGSSNPAVATPSVDPSTDSVLQDLPSSAPSPGTNLPTPGVYAPLPIVAPQVPAGTPSVAQVRRGGGVPSVTVSAHTGPNPSGRPVTDTASGAAAGTHTTESSTVTYNGHVIEHESGNAPSGSISVPVQSDHGTVVASGYWRTGPGSPAPVTSSAAASAGGSTPSDPVPNRGPAGGHPAGYNPAIPSNGGPLSVWYGNEPTLASSVVPTPASAGPSPGATPLKTAADLPSRPAVLPDHLIAARPNNPPPSPFTNNQSPPTPNASNSYLNDPALTRQFTQQLPANLDIWDNSNSQYGLLGVWSGAEVGCEVPNGYWAQVEKHWTGCELPTGQWTYSAYDPEPTLSMSCAGVASLLVCHEWMDWPAAGNRVGRAPYSPSLARGLQWLEAGNNVTNVVTPDLKYLGYTAYGIERTALASGFKYFGTHDWYSELANQLIPYQFPNGAWGNAADGTDSATVNTAYLVLFLSRGRHPVLMNKLRFEPYWDNRPKDVANLAKYAGIELERPFNWQVVSAARPWSDWTDSPVLYIASHRPPTLTDADCDKLKAYAEAGGLIFTHADSNSAGFNNWVEQLQKRLWPQYDLKPIPRDSAVYSSNYHLANDKKVPDLKGIYNGSRYLLIHCPTDALSPAWQDAATSQKDEFQMGINLFVYSAGHASFRNRLDSPFIPEPTTPATSAVKVARIKYDGNWNPEPYAWTRFARYLQWTVGTAVQTAPVELADLKPADAPVAVLTGNAAVQFTDAQAAAVRAYVQAGGTLLVDSTGGNADFAKSASDLIAKALPQNAPVAVTPADPLVAGGTILLDDLTKPVGRPYNTEAQIKTTPVQIIHAGQGRVIFTPLDITTGLLGTNTWGIAGYDPEYAQRLVKNVVETTGTP